MKTKILMATIIATTLAATLTATVATATSDFSNLASKGSSSISSFQQLLEAEASDIKLEGQVALKQRALQGAQASLSFHRDKLSQIVTKAKIEELVYNVDRTELELETLIAERSAKSAELIFLQQQIRDQIFAPEDLQNLNSLWVVRRSVAETHLRLKQREHIYQQARLDRLERLYRKRTVAKIDVDAASSKVSRANIQLQQLHKYIEFIDRVRDRLRST